MGTSICKKNTRKLKNHEKLPKIKSLKVTCKSWPSGGLNFLRVLAIWVPHPTGEVYLLGSASPWCWGAMHQLRIAPGEKSAWVPRHTVNPQLESSIWILNMNPQLESSTDFSTASSSCMLNLKSSTWVLNLNPQFESSTESSTWILNLNSSSWILNLSPQLEPPNSQVPSMPPCETVFKSTRGPSMILVKQWL